MHHIRLGALLALVAVAACARPPSDEATGSGQSRVPTGPQAPLISTDTATDPTVRRLEREAIALARTDGCATAGQCRAAPLGNRPCGGPRFYLPYCPLTTDSTALFAKLAEVFKAEDDYNRRSGLFSTCEYRMPPDLAVTAGVCHARTPGS